MERVKEEYLYWEKESLGDIDRNVCDPNLEDFCFSMVNIPDSGNVLEIGCGIGRLLKMIKKKKDLNIFGIDISSGMIQECKKRLEKRKDIVVDVSDGRSIPFQDGYFDYIYSIAVFQHIDDNGVREYMREVKRVLKKGGRFCFQFVEGKEKIAFSWQRSEDQLVEMICGEGLRIDSFGMSPRMINWNFIYGGN